MKTRITYLIVLILASLYIGWASHELTTNPQIIEVEKPVVVERLVVQAVEIEKPIYIDRPVYLDRVVEKPVITPLVSTDNVDFDKMLYMIELGISSHQFKVDNPILHQQFPGHPVEQEWVDFYRKLNEIFREIKDRKQKEIITPRVWEIPPPPVPPRP